MQASTDKTFSGKHAIVTGAAGDIGTAIAMTLADAGAYSCSAGS